MGKLLGIARKAKIRAPMEKLASARVGVGTGIEGDRRGGNANRNVTVLSADVWKTVCAELGVDLPWTTRRANLLVSGLDLKATIGARIRIGAVLLQVCEETEPCNRMDLEHMGLRAALEPDWRGGACCIVREPGEIAVGAEATMEPTASAEQRAP